MPASHAPPPPPLATTYRHLTRLCEPLDVAITGDLTEGTAGAPGAGCGAHRGGAGAGLGAGGVAYAGGAVSAADLVADPDALAAVIDGESDRILAAHGDRPRHDVAASRLLHHYLWTVCLLFTGPWCLDRWVPRIPRDAVRLDPGTGDVTLDVRGVTYSPGDCDILRAAVAEHAGPLLDAFAPHIRRGPRALWGMVTDDLASGLWILGRALGDEERGLREATALLPGATSPFPGAASFRRLRAPSGRLHPTRTRLSCCLHYAITPDSPCLTCPRLPDHERLRRLEES